MGDDLLWEDGDVDDLATVDDASPGSDDNDHGKGSSARLGDDKGDGDKGSKGDVPVPGLDDPEADSVRDVPTPGQGEGVAAVAGNGSEEDGAKDEDGDVGPFKVRVLIIGVLLKSSVVVCCCVFVLL